MKRVFLVVILFLFSISLFSAIYEKVTSAPSDWSGQYLIVYEAGNVAFDGSLTDLDVASNNKSVEIVDSRIFVTEDNFYFTIEKDVGNYRIQSASGYYIGFDKDANGLSGSQERNLSNYILFDKSDESTFDVNIKSMGGSYLRYNAASNQTRFRYYKSSTYTDQKAIQLYRLVDGAEEQTYRVTLYNGGVQYGDILEGDFVNLPMTGPTLSPECQFAGWEFAGWSETEITEDVTEVQLVDNPYIPTQDCSLYAVYKMDRSDDENAISWELIDIESIKNTDDVVITMTTEAGKVYAMANDNGKSNPTAIEVNVVNNMLSLAYKENLIWNISTSESKHIIYPKGITSEWLCSKDGKTDLYIGTGNYKEFVMDGNYLKNIQTGRYLRVYESESVLDWRAYAAKPNQTLRFYVKSMDFDMIIYNSNPDCAEIEESVVVFGDVAIETVLGKIADIPELPESCNPEYQTKVGWTMATEVGVVDRPVLVDENTLFTQDTKLYPVYSKELDESVWRIVTNEANIEFGDQIVIAAKDYDYAISTQQNGENRGQAAITRNGDYITFGENVKQIKVEDGLLDNTFAFNVGGVYLYAASSSSNQMKTEQILSENSSWKITIVDKVASIVAQGDKTHNVMSYNSSSDLFSCYLPNNTQKDLAIYKKITTEYYICGDIEIESGDVYVVGDDLVLNTLTIKSDRDEAGEMKVEAGVVTINSVVVEKTIDDSRWYFFSLPFDCRILDIVAIDANGRTLEYALDATSGDYVINEYDQVRSNETGKAWRELLGTQHTLNAGQGYIIGHFGAGEVTVKFKSSAPQTISIPADKKLNYTDTWIVDGENSTRGFNLIGLPYYQQVEGSLTPEFVTIPNKDGKTYTQTEYVNANIAPFTSFFVQTQEAPKFVVSAINSVPKLRANALINKAIISLTDANGGKDQTTVINNQNATADYEIGLDLVKWIGYASLPQIYSIQGGDMLAFNSLTMDDFTVIPLGVYAHDSGEYTFALDEKSMGDLQDWVLYDNEEGVAIRLIDSTYSIYLEKGAHEVRFDLRLQQRISTECGNTMGGIRAWTQRGTLNIDNVPMDAVIYIYDAVGRMVDMLTPKSQLISYDFVVRGVYNVVVYSSVKTITFKTIY